MESSELIDFNSCLDVHTLALGTRPSSSPLSPRRPRLLGGAHRAAAASSWPELLFGGGQKGFFKAAAHCLKAIVTVNGCAYGGGWTTASVSSLTRRLSLNNRLG